MTTYHVKKLTALFLLSTTIVFTPAINAEPPNLDKLKVAVVHYHDSGDYNREIQMVIHKAERYINHRVSINEHSRHPQKLAIVLDIDETSLSNYSKMKERQFVATKAQLTKETLAADAPAIKPTLALYRDALQHHVAVFFVTGRHDNAAEKNATVKNLKRAGFSQWNGMYFKPENDHQKSAIPYKSHARALITQQGYTIIASIGDQCSDIKGGYAEKGFKLPNPYYYLP